MEKKGLASIITIILVISIAIAGILIVFNIIDTVTTNKSKDIETGFKKYLQELGFKDKEDKLREIDKLYKNEKLGDIWEINKDKTGSYIVQFDDKPVLEKKNELDGKAEKAKEFTEEHPFLSAVTLYRHWAITSDDISYKIEKYSEDLKKENKRIKEDIFLEVKKKRTKITGKVVSDLDSEVEIMNEFHNVFNGIALDVSEEEIKEIAEISGVKKVYPNLIYHTTLMDSVPLINTDDVWKLDEDGNDCSVSEKPCLTGEGITIGILDTGIDYTHPDLGGCFGDGCKVTGGYDFVNDDDNPIDDKGHGTHVAGIAAGNGALKGVAPDAELYAYKVLDNKGSGDGDDIIAAIEKAVDPNQDEDFSDHLDIISLSLGANCKENYGKYTFDCGPDDPVSMAIDNAVDTGVVAVVSAGNKGYQNERGTIGSPGTARKAITVGAFDNGYYPDFMTLSFSSSRGPVIWEAVNGKTYALVKPDIIAPGINICSAKSSSYNPAYTCHDENHVKMSGTSMAAPHVSGTIALLKQRDPDLNSKKIKSLLKSTAIPVDPLLQTYAREASVVDQGSGLIDSLEAVLFDNPLEVSLEPLEINLDKIHSITEYELTIKGEIAGDNFDYYVLSYSKDLLPLVEYRPSDWIEITTSNIIPSDNILYDGFDVYSFRGEYIVRLQVFDISGREFTDYSYFKVSSNECDDGLDNDRDGATDVIDAGCENIEDDDETNCGDSVCEELESRVLCTQDCGGEEFPSQLPGWPLYFEADYKYPHLPETRTLHFYLRDIKTEDLNNDNYPEIFIKGYHPFPCGGAVLAIYDSQGNLYPGWPQRAPDRNIYSYAIGRNGNEKIIVVSTKQDVIKDCPEEHQSIFVFDSSGNVINTWPYESNYPGEGFLDLSDLDNDGNSEIILINIPKGDPKELKIEVFDINGDIKNGWPKRFSLDSASSMGLVVAAEVGDLDNNGFKEIVTWQEESCWWNNQYSKLIILSHEGKTIFRETIPNMCYVYGIILKDIDKDEKLEIIAGTDGCIKDEPTELGSLIFVFEDDGSIKQGWPQRVADPKRGHRNHAFRVVDFEEDGYFEIVAASNRPYGNYDNYIYVFDYQGNIREGWPFVADFEGSGVKGLIVEDVNRDNKKEILYTIAYSKNIEGVFTSFQYLYVFDENGNLLENFPKSIAPIFKLDIDDFNIVDVNNDGIKEILVPERLSSLESEDVYHGYTHVFTSFPWIGLSENCDITGDEDGNDLEDCQDPVCNEKSCNNGLGICKSQICVPSIWISNCKELQNINKNLESDYLLKNNIDCSGFYFQPIGYSNGNYWQDNPGTPFTGTFDGQGYKIINLEINSDSYGPYGVGLFAYTNGADISSLGLENVNINGYSGVGALIGYAFNTNIEEVYSTGSVSAQGNYAGGLVSLLSDSDIYDSYSKAYVSGNHEIGGAVGYMVEDSNLINAYATGNVMGSCKTGGLVGETYSTGRIENSFATGSVSGMSCSEGGLIGLYSGDTTVINSYWYSDSHSSCTGENYASDCYSVSDISEFYNVDNEPMMKWDFEEVWEGVEGNYAILKVF